MGNIDAPVLIHKFNYFLRIQRRGGIKGVEWVLLHAAVFGVHLLVTSVPLHPVALLMDHEHVLAAILLRRQCALAGLTSVNVSVPF